MEASPSAGGDIAAVYKKYTKTNDKASKAPPARSAARASPAVQDPWLASIAFNSPAGFKGGGPVVSAAATAGASTSTTPAAATSVSSSSVSLDDVNSDFLNNLDFDAVTTSSAVVQQLSDNNNTNSSSPILSTLSPSQITYTGFDTFDLRNEFSLSRSSSSSVTCCPSSNSSSPTLPDDNSIEIDLDSFFDFDQIFEPSPSLSTLSYTSASTAATPTPPPPASLDTSPHPVILGGFTHSPFMDGGFDVTLGDSHSSPQVNHLTQLGLALATKPEGLNIPLDLTAAHLSAAANTNSTSQDKMVDPNSMFNFDADFALYPPLPAHRAMSSMAAKNNNSPSHHTPLLPPLLSPAPTSADEDHYTTSTAGKRKSPSTPSTSTSRPSKKKTMSASNTPSVEPTGLPRPASPSQVLVESADSAAIKRARNTLAARRYRQKRLERLEELEALLEEQERETQRWKEEAMRWQVECEGWKGRFEGMMKGRYD